MSPALTVISHHGSTQRWVTYRKPPSGHHDTAQHVVAVPLDGALDAVGNVRVAGGSRPATGPGGQRTPAGCGQSSAVAARPRPLCAPPVCASWDGLRAVAYLWAGRAKPASAEPTDRFTPPGSRSTASTGASDMRSAIIRRTPSNAGATARRPRTAVRSQAEQDLRTMPSPGKLGGRFRPLVLSATKRPNGLFAVAVLRRVGRPGSGMTGEFARAFPPARHAAGKNCNGVNAGIRIL